MPDLLKTFQERQDYAEALREVFAEQMRDLARQRMAGTISPSDWQGQMRSLLKTQYGMMVVVAAGGDPSKVSADDWLALGPQLKSQYRYVERFNRQIESGDVANFEGRAAMYGMSSYQMFWEQAAPVRLPARPGDGTTACKVNCKCKWRFEYQRNAGGRVTAVLAFWELQPAEHCPDCKRRAQMWNPLIVKVGKKFEEDPAFAEAA
jgi:hypothetical protein